MVIAVCALVGCGGTDDTPKQDAKDVPTQNATEAPERTVAEVPPPQCTPLKQSRFTVSPHWDVGDEQALTITKTETSSDPGDSGESASTASLKVLNVGRRASLLEFSSDQLGQVRGMEALREIEAGFSLRFLTDSDGAYARVVGADKLRDEIRAQINAGIDDLDTAGDQAAMARVEKARELVTSDEFITNNLTLELQLLTYAYGFQFAPGQTERSFPSSIAHPFGGPDLAARGTVELVDRRDADGCVRVRMTNEVRPAAGRRFAREFADQVGASGELDDAPLMLSAVIEAQWDSGSGWVTHLDVNQDKAVGDSKSNTHTVIDSR